MKTFKDVWEDAANSVGAGGVSMPSDAVHDKKKRRKTFTMAEQKPAVNLLKEFLLEEKQLSLKKKLKKT